MKSVTDLLREADPLSQDTASGEERARIRRAVVAASSSREARPVVSRRRAVIGTASALAGFVILGVLFGSGGQDTLQAAVRLEVHLADAQPVAGSIVAEVADSGRIIYIDPKTIVDNDDIAQAWVTEDGANQFGVSVQLFEDGAQRMRQATAANLGRLIAVLIDGQVVMAPIIRSATSDSAVITGEFSRAEAKRIVEGIRAR